jgi:hypothetical protein
MIRAAQEGHIKDRTSVAVKEIRIQCQNYKYHQWAYLRSDTKEGEPEELKVSTEIMLRTLWSGYHGRIIVWSRGFSHFHHAQTRSMAHPASCLTKTRCSFPLGTPAIAWNCSVTSDQCQGSEYIEVHHGSMTSWHYAQQDKHTSHFTWQKYKICMISCFCCSINETFSHLRCYAVFNGSQLLMLQTTSRSQNVSN